MDRAPREAVVLPGVSRRIAAEQNGAPSGGVICHRCCPTRRRTRDWKALGPGRAVVFPRVAERHGSLAGTAEEDDPTSPGIVRHRRLVPGGWTGRERDLDPRRPVELPGVGDRSARKATRIPTEQ